jgi:hypothetical protein
MRKSDEAERGDGALETPGDDNATTRMTATETATGFETETATATATTTTTYMDSLPEYRHDMFLLFLLLLVSFSPLHSRPESTQLLLHRLAFDRWLVILCDLVLYQLVIKLVLIDICRDFFLVMLVCLSP